MMRRAILGGALAGAAVLSGCGTAHLTGSSIEKLITQEVGSRGYPGITVKCPDVTDKVGTKFTCDVSGNPKISKVDGTVAPGDKINLDALH